MSETVGESRLIEDKELAETVAYAAKDLRSTAAAKRQIDSILAEAKDAMVEKNGIKSMPEIITRIIGIYAIYPEVFNKIFGNGAEEESEMFSQVSQLLRIGELPTRNIVGYDDRHDADIFDERANELEGIAEALEASRPSQEFLKDFQLGHDTYLGSKEKGNQYVVTLEDVRKLLDSIKYNNRRMNIVEAELLNSNLDLAEANSSQNQLQRVLYSLEMVDLYMPTGSKEQRKDFSDRVNEARNSEETTMAYLRALYSQGLVIALELYTKIRDKKQEIYDAIISGEAATYKTPEVDSE